MYSTFYCGFLVIFAALPTPIIEAIIVVKHNNSDPFPGNAPNPYAVHSNNQSPLNLVACYDFSTASRKTLLACENGCIYRHHDYRGAPSGCDPEKRSIKEPYCVQDTIRAASDPKYICYCSTNYCNAQEDMEEVIREMRYPKNSANVFVTLFSACIALLTLAVL